MGLCRSEGRTLQHIVAPALAGLNMLLGDSRKVPSELDDLIIVEVVP